MKLKENKQKITIVIPTYNEAKTIEDMVKRTKKLYDNVLIIDSIKSNDNIEKVIGKYGVKIIKDKGKGKGHAIRVGIDNVKDGIIVFMDADGSHIPEDIPHIVKPILDGKAELVIASRFTGGSEELFDGTLNGLLRTFFTMAISVILNKRFKIDIKDPENGFRAMKVSLAKKLNFVSNNFDIETEEIMKFAKHKYRILEVPSRELNRKEGVAKLSIIKTGFNIMWRMFVNFF